jgi:hypothetical protein
MELRRIKLIQELKEAREELLNINFENSPDTPYFLVNAWVSKWETTFRRCVTLDYHIGNIGRPVMRAMDGYEQEKDAEIYNDTTPIFVGYIDQGLRILDQEHEVRPLLEDYIKRVKDTKLAVLLKEFNLVKDVAPNHASMGFRTILCLVIQERAKRVNSTSKTATRTDLAVDEVIRDAKADGTLSGDEKRFVNTFVSMHKDIYDLVVHRPGADNMVDKNEVDAMVDLLNKLLPAIIN